MAPNDFQTPDRCLGCWDWQASCCCPNEASIAEVAKEIRRLREAEGTDAKDVAPSFVKTDGDWITQLARLAAERRKSNLEDNQFKR